MASDGPSDQDWKHYQQPDQSGHFGTYGGRFVAETLMAPLLELTAAYERYANDAQFQQELDLDLGNIFHNTLSWFFTDDPDQIGQWGVETRHPRLYRAGSSAIRGGAVSGIPGRNAAMCVLAELGH